MKFIYILFIFLFFSCKEVRIENNNAPCHFGISYRWNEDLNIYLRSGFLNRKNQIESFENFNQIDLVLDSVIVESNQFLPGFHPDSQFYFINSCSRSESTFNLFQKNYRLKRIKSNIERIEQDLITIDRNFDQYTKTLRLLKIMFTEFRPYKSPIISKSYFQNYPTLGFFQDIQSIRTYILTLN
jgi:hypothetical protein